MKKFIAAALLIIYLFNIGGQIVLHQYFAYVADKFFNEQTQKGLYNKADLTEIQIPVNMPGITDWKSYVKVSGQIQFQNASYNYIKMKMTRTTLYLVCVPDYKTTHFAGQNILNAKNIPDIPVPKKNHVPFAKTTLLDKFNLASLQITFIAPVKMPVKSLEQSYRQVINYFTDIPEQPPKLSC